MQDEYSLEQDRVFSLDEFKQFDRLNQNTNSRIPIFFCVDELLHIIIEQFCNRQL